MFKQITSIETLNNDINNQTLSLVYFGQPNCSVCHGLKPQIETKLAEFSEDISFMEVNTLEVPEVSGDYQVMTVPVVLLFVEGKEYMRKARFVPMQELYHNVQKIVEGVKGMDMPMNN